MELIPEWAPNLHPMFVHFPIAVLLLAVLMNMAGFFLPVGWWDELKTTVLYGIGAVSAVVVYYSGTVAADSVFMPSETQSLLNEHADWAWWTVWFFGIYTLVRMFLHWYKITSHKSIRIAALAVALPGVFLLYETGEHGAEMVYGYGVGTGTLLEPQQYTPAELSDSLTAENKTSFSIENSGDWSWLVGPNGVSTLLAKFRWLEGSVQDLQPTVVGNENNYLLRLNAGSSLNFFVGNNSYKNVQVDYYLDLSDFKGEVSLVNHVQDAQNYDFVTLTSDGTISHGRVNGGNREVFAEESYSASGMLFIRTVGNGTHFRGYVNKEMAVHGHGDAPKAGSIGLRLDGSGSVLIDAIEFMNLSGH